MVTLPLDVFGRCLPKGAAFQPLFHLAAEIVRGAFAVMLSSTVCEFVAEDQEERQEVPPGPRVSVPNHPAQGRQRAAGPGFPSCIAVRVLMEWLGPLGSAQTGPE